MSDASRCTAFRVMHMKIGEGDEGDLEDSKHDAKSVGVYRSLAEAEAVVHDLRANVPHYQEWRDGFRIYPVVLDQPGWPVAAGGTVFRLFHFKIVEGEPGDPEDTDNAKEIGLYVSVAHAEAAVRRLIHLPGFCDWPHGFRIYPAVIDQVGWPDGFTEADADRAYWDWPTEEIIPG